MIIWIASYPKSGNTWLRALISSYYYSSDGEFNFNLLKNIESFPQKKFFLQYSSDFSSPTQTTYYWIKAQKKINQESKLKFLKTHNSFCNIGGNNFTDKENTLGCIYIVRDPRNVITSLKNHYELDYEKSLDFMINEKKYICDSNVKNDFGNIQFLSSWKKHCSSWLENKIFPVKLVRYEDLVQNTFAVFKEVVEFINNITKNSKKLNKEKAKKTIQSSSFDNLKAKELMGEFTESVYSKKNKKKLVFFNMGPNNNWKKNVPEQLQDQINLKLKNDLYI
jgi:hypothetical protein